MNLVYGDIAEVVMRERPDAVVHAANAVGWMGGWVGKYVRMRGVAESLHYATKGRLEPVVKRECRRVQARPGDVVVTTSVPPLPEHCLVLHAVTMMRPGQRAEFKAVARCLVSLRHVVEEQEIRHMVMPLLGTGTGRLPREVVYAALSEWENTLPRETLVQVVTL